MKILAIHNYHRKGSASGDDLVFRNETELLERRGNTVIRYTVSNDIFDEKNRLQKITDVFGMFWSFKHYNAVKKIIITEKPGLIHVHTFFPLLSPSVLYAAKRMGCKVVATLHDTRFVCPCAASLRGGKICNSCGDGHYFRMCRYRCFKGSIIQSFIVACIFTYHRIRKSFYKQIDRYICLNDQQIRLLKSIGFDSNKIVKKYNYIEDREVEASCKNGLPERYVVFYGRIGEEKGIRALMKMWDGISAIPLVVMGDGPLRSEFETWAAKKNNVYYLGYIKHTECLSIVKKGEFTIFPSIWYEGCSMVEIESECLGKAVIATDLGFSSEAIEDGFNGYKIPDGDVGEFVKKIVELWNNPRLCKEMGENARYDYMMKYYPDDNYDQLMKIYKSAVSTEYR